MLLQVDLAVGLGSKKLRDKETRAKVAPKLEQLRTTFDEQVKTPVWAEPPDLDKVRTGVDQCLAIVAEMRAILGG